MLGFSQVIADSLCKLVQSLFHQCFVNLMGALSILLFFFLIPFLLKLSVACRLCVIYVREDYDSNAQAVITPLIWTSLSAVPRKAIEFNHSLTHLTL